MLQPTSTILLREIWIYETLGDLEMQSALQMITEPCWWLTAPEKPELFVRELTRIVPLFDVIYLEGISSASEVQDFLEMVSFDPPAWPETVQSKGKRYAILLCDSNLNIFSDLLVRRPEEEICSQLFVGNQTNLLVQWANFPSGNIMVSSLVPEDKIRDLVSQWNGKYSNKQPEKH